MSTYIPSEKLRFFDQLSVSSEERGLGTKFNPSHRSKREAKEFESIYHLERSGRLKDFLHLDRSERLKVLVNLSSQAKRSSIPSLTYISSATRGLTVLSQRGDYQKRLQRSCGYERKNSSSHQKALHKLENLLQNPSGVY